ncbi:Mss4-like protein [Chytriomyces sp. MP71]|nr:Mss4-like protein [Chytriomyces sp. MP71]
MLLFTDVISGDEVLSDAYKLIDVDDFLYEVDCSMIKIREGDVDIGANASAEGGDGDDGVEEGEQIVNNVVYSFRLQSSGFDKKGYMTYIKGYMKALKEHLTATNSPRLEQFEAKAKVAVKKILDNFGDFEFYVSEGMNPEGMVLLLNYREDGTTPYFTFWKDGLKSQKV